MSPTGRKNLILSLFQAMRPAQWVKNGFVAAPLLFSGQFHEAGQCRKVLIALLSFCAAASAVYLVNDIRDRREDQNHPEKKHRPIASGALTIPLAWAWTFVLVGGALLSGYGLGLRFLGTVMIYLILSILYSWALKHVAILDVMILSAGFVLRILGGSLAIQVTPSHWLILCTTMISLFLGFAKRRAELVEQKDSDNNQMTRIVLKDYSIAFLDQVIPLVTGATIICYALYTVDQRTLEVFGSRAMLLTLPFVIYGLFRYIYLTYHLNKGQDPTQTLLKDIPTLLNLILWVATALLVVNYGRRFDLF